MKSGLSYIIGDEDSTMYSRGTIHFVGTAESRVSPEEGERILAKRTAYPTMAADPQGVTL